MASKRDISLWILFQFGNLLIAATLGWGSSDKIKLTDVDIITLVHGKMTNSRRTRPVPQLKCVGGSAGCSAFIPKTVMCYNRGSDGNNVQWECQTYMNSHFQFGKIAVNCEGYAYPDDPYVLKDSCGLEYTIDIVNSHHSGHHNHDTRSSFSQCSSIGKVCILAFAILLMACCIYDQRIITQLIRIPFIMFNTNRRGHRPEPGYKYNRGGSSASLSSGFGGTKRR